MSTDRSRMGYRLPLWQRISYSESFWGYLFLAPTIVGLLAFSAGPIVASAVVSLTKWNMMSTPVWRGLGNYQDLWRDQLFWTALRNTLRYMLGVIPLSMGVSLVLALSLNQGLRFETLFRSLYFTPSVCSAVALAFVWRLMYDHNFGLLNWLLGLLNIQKVPWLLTPRTAMPAVIIMSAWTAIGYPTVLLLAVLQGVPQVYYDAAQVDGAGRWAQFWYVTWPFLTPTAFFMLVISCINSFQMFEQTYILTGGGPNRSTYTLVFYIYDRAFRQAYMGYAGAIAYVLFFFVLGLTILQFRMQREWVHYEVA